MTIVEIKDKIEESLEQKIERFQKFWKIFKGGQNLDEQANIILNPAKIQTSSYLSNDQVEFVSTSFFIPKHFPELEPLKEYADEFLYTNLSKDGFAVEHAIAYQQAISEKRLMQLGLKTTGEQPKNEKSAKTKE